MNDGFLSGQSSCALPHALGNVKQMLLPPWHESQGRLDPTHSALASHPSSGWDARIISHEWFPFHGYSQKEM